jgi:ribosomal protein S18 acetylase RimI-like enzyme
MTVRVRRATEHDIDALVRLEEVFPGDRFDAKHIRYHLGRSDSTVFVADDDSAVVGSAFVLWRRNMGLARLYSIAVDPSRQGGGVGALLLGEAEKAAVRRGLGGMILEVREDNRNARVFYEKRGYRVTATLPRYYEDDAPGVRMAKRLLEDPLPDARLDVPYYGQTEEFTCGPACLMMAMKHADPAMHLTRTLEFVLWKEATLIFMTSGVGGCGPMGLSVAARRRGFRVETAVSNRAVPFLSSVRAREKKEVVTLVHHEQRREAIERGVEVETFGFSLATLSEGMRRGLVPIVLISTFRLHKIRSPHWVVVTGIDAGGVTFHDPYEAFYVHDSRKGRNMVVPSEEFMRMTAFGSSAFRAVVLVGAG